VRHSRRHILSKALGPLEEEIMEVTWRAGDVTIRDVHEVLQEGEPIAYTTVATTMHRLTQKGFLARHRTRRACGYAARVTREQYASSIAESVLDWLVTHFPGPTVDYFVDRMEDDKEVMEHLRLEISRRRSTENQHLELGDESPKV
jgi:predicted transcriptional regulator